MQIVKLRNNMENTTRYINCYFYTECQILEYFMKGCIPNCKFKKKSKQPDLTCNDCCYREGKVTDYPCNSCFNSEADFHLTKFKKGEPI